MMSGYFNSCCRRVFALASCGRRLRLSRFAVKFTAALMLLVPSAPASGTLPSLPPVEEGKGPSFFLFRSMADSVMASARQGNARAQFLTGVCYYIGRGVGKDLKEAFQWFSRAAQQGDPESQFYLGVMHECGEGVEQDQKIAYGWFQAAAMQGHTYAQFFKERMEQGQPGPPGLLLSATQLLHHMGNIFRDNVPEDSTSTGLHIDHKRLQALQEKRIALGHRPDDHVEEQSMGGMTM